MTTAIYNFVAEDFNDTVWYEEPVRQTVEDLRPHFNTFIQACRQWGRDIPDGLTAATYTEAWNAMVCFRTGSLAHC